MVLRITILIAFMPIFHTEYIPPGPAYNCPKTETQLLHPCVCEKGTDAGLYVTCTNAGLAVLSVGLGNLAQLEIPIERLVLKECTISHLFGPLFHRSLIRVLHIIDTPIKSIDEFAFFGVNRTLQELYMFNTELAQFPKDGVKILGNLTILHIDGHEMTKLDKDMFAGSHAVGKLERLRLTNGMIEDIVPEAMQNLRKLKTLDLHGNRLATLKKNQFKGLREIDVLDLSYNNISKLEGIHISDLTKLGWCNVSHNQIGQISKGMFARNTLVKVLHLDNNKIKKIDTSSFRGMRFLRRLFLSDNNISDVGRGSFTSLTRIGTIDLARNMIKKVDFQMFQAVKYAELINLAENQITVIEKQAFTDLYLATVNISHNALSAIEKGAFQNCNNMTILDLSYNKLKNISKGAFDENSYASILQLSYNEFEDFMQVPIQNMSGLTVLNVTHNSIEKIPKMAFPKLYELHTVDLSYNNITEIFNAVFQNLFSLRYINLTHNELEVLKPSTFGTLPTVLHLDLSHNRLREISTYSLAKLASCREMNLSWNKLEKVFQIPISLGEIDISHNNIKEIQANAWPTMNSLLRINLSHNQLADRLDSSSFAGLLTLQRLDLSGNGVTRVPWETVSPLTSLQYLFLQDNNITALSKSAFGNLLTTFAIDLSRNQLADVSRHAFIGLQQLQNLSLSGNMLKYIPNEAFKGLVALRNLDLSYNMLEKIDNKTHGLLDDCLSLERVNLSHNRIGFLTKKMFPSNPWIPYRLREIDLSHNTIPVVTFDITYGTAHLKRLYLAGNVINDVRNNVLGNLTSLEILDLSNNDIKDLISIASDAKFNLPPNITEIYINNNSLETLPIDNIVNATKLKILDVRKNDLDVYYPELVDRIRMGLHVYFDGNKLNCDCIVRPLVHYLDRLPPSILKASENYQNITCASPLHMENTNILEIQEERFLCAGNTELEEKLAKYGNTDKFGFTSEPDLEFRDVQYSQQAIYVHWYVKSTADIADFSIYVRDENNTIYHSSNIQYNLRSTTITIDNELLTSLENGGKIDVCVQAKTSKDFARKFYPSQCQTAPTNYKSWSKKLNLDRRRLSKKKIAYSWFSSSVLGLVSDSILITLCIFLGVCFRRLADLDI